MSQYTLHSFQSATEKTEQLFDWIFMTIQPFLKGRILETDSGQGYFSSKLSADGYTIQLNAISEPNREELQARFKNAAMVRGVHKINFQTSKMELKYVGFKDQFATVLAICEIPGFHSFHTEMPVKALRFLQSEGHLIIVGKSTIELFPNSQADIAELKRYHRADLKRLFIGCDILKVEYFDYDGLFFLAVGKKH